MIEMLSHFILIAFISLWTNQGFMSVDFLRGEIDWFWGLKVFVVVAVQALQVMYTSLNSPSQLTNWKSNGGDPCAESWKGITCEGSAVVSMWESALRFMHLIDLVV